MRPKNDDGDHVLGARGWPVGVGHDDGGLVVDTNQQRAVLVLVLLEVKMELQEVGGRISVVAVVDGADEK